MIVTGPNGSGKTTLLEALAGIIGMESGTVRFGGAVVGPSSLEWRRQTSFTPADGGTIPVLTVVEQLALAAALDGIETAEANNRMEAVLTLFGLREYASRRAAHLSAGTCKRLGLAIAAMRTAPIYLFDEPASGLDEDGVGLVRELLSGVVDAPRRQTCWRNHWHDRSPVNR